MNNYFAKTDLIAEAIWKTGNLTELRAKFGLGTIQVYGECAISADKVKEISDYFGKPIEGLFTIGNHNTTHSRYKIFLPINQLEKARRLDVTQISASNGLNSTYLKRSLRHNLFSHSEAVAVAKAMGYENPKDIFQVERA